MLLPREMRPGSIAYLSMEVGLDSSMPTYSGGLGILAGDTLRAAADLGLPMIGVTLLHRQGYFHQHLDCTGNQLECPAAWNFEEVLEPMAPRILVPIEGQQVHVCAWRHIVRGVFGHTVPVYFLDTGLDDNSPGRAEPDRCIVRWELLPPLVSRSRVGDGRDSDAGRPWLQERPYLSHERGTCRIFDPGALRKTDQRRRAFGGDGVGTRGSSPTLRVYHS